jgi:hypothetical protein
MLLLVEILESLVNQTQLITAVKGEEPDLASLVSQEISAMDQAIEEVSILKNFFFCYCTSNFC